MWYWLTNVKINGELVQVMGRRMQMIIIVSSNSQFLVKESQMNGCKDTMFWHGTWRLLLVLECIWDLYLSI